MATGQAIVIVRRHWYCRGLSSVIDSSLLVNAECLTAVVVWIANAHRLERFEGTGSARRPSIETPVVSSVGMHDLRRWQVREPARCTIVGQNGGSRCYPGVVAGRLNGVATS